MNMNLLKNALREKNSAALIYSEENRRYFTEFPSSDGWLLVTGEKAIFFTDSRYIEAASLECKGCDEVKLFKRMSESVKPVIEEMGVKKLSVEASRITLSVLSALEKALEIEFVTDSTLDDIIDSVRIKKNESEVELIVKAQRIAEKAFEHICRFIKVGMTEKEIGLELDYFMLRNGADALSFETIAVCGEKTSMPHGVPGENKVKAGDFVTMDYGAVCGGYHSDMTRTVAVGYATDEMKKVYNTVLSAQSAAFELMKPGVPCTDVDKAGRDVIENAGYGEYFGHSLGHGVGVEIHEMPAVSPRSENVLEAGYVITNEPGIYLPGKFGVRIEDMAYITKDGYRNLTNAPKELIVLNN